MHEIKFFSLKLRFLFAISLLSLYYLVSFLFPQFPIPKADTIASVIATDYSGVFIDFVEDFHYTE